LRLEYQAFVYVFVYVYACVLILYLRFFTLFLTPLESYDLYDLYLPLHPSADMETLRQEFSSTIAELQAEIQRQRDELALLRTRTNQRPKPSLPDPEKFTGQAHKFDTWLPLIKAKLRVDGTAIGDAVAQFYYVYLNLDSHVQAMVLPQLGQAEEDKDWNYKAILSQLSRVYDNPNKVQEAEDRLYALKQGSDSALVYIAKFERVLYEARGQD